MGHGGIMRGKGVTGVKRLYTEDEKGAVEGGQLVVEEKKCKKFADKRKEWRLKEINDYRQTRRKMERRKKMERKEDGTRRGIEE